LEAEAVVSGVVRGPTGDVITAVVTIGAFEGSFETVREALARVHHVFDPGHAIKRSEKGSHEPERLRPLISRPISVSLTATTVREILNQLVAAHGAMSWVAEYSDVSGAYRDIRISFVGFDGWFDWLGSSTTLKPMCIRQQRSDILRYY